MQNLASIIESLLFVHGEPIPVNRLALLAKAGQKDVEAALAELDERLKGRGIVLLKNNGEYQLGSHPENAPHVENLVQEEFSGELTKQALETLSIIAYRGPIAKAEIDYLRGVNTGFMLRNLSLRGLIERVENKKDGRSHRYQASFDFLKNLGVTSLDELPDYGVLHSKEIDIPQIP